MQKQSAPTSRNQEEAAFFVLADELGLPATTIAWISAAVGVLSDRKSPSASHSDARELCSALLRDLNEFYSGDIEAGLRQMQISCSEDVGRVVWGLVSKQMIQVDPNDRASQFNGVFRIEDLEHFLSSEGIRRARFSWIRCKRYTSWALYIAGTLVVIDSYAGLVSQRTAWIGWGVGMVGFGLSHLPDPKPKRF
jgi:hypothetical protein